jgi:hypothetical protein
MLFRTRPYCLDLLCAGELPATRDSGVCLSLTTSPFRKLRRRVSQNRSKVCVALKSPRLLLDMEMLQYTVIIFVEMYDAWII